MYYHAFFEVRALLIPLGRSLKLVRDLKEVIHMYSSELSNFSFWCLVPILMMILCFILMRGRRGSMMCGFSSRSIDSQQTRASDSALDILDRRCASGEINKAEYEEVKRTLTQTKPINPEQS